MALRRLAGRVGVVLLAALLWPPAAAQARPNVLLVSLDTLRADAVGVMPALRRLASHGLAFTHALSAAPWTVPSHAALVTGRSPFHLSCKAREQNLIGEEPTLMTLLDAAGYEVGVATEMAVLSAKEGYAAGTTHFWTGKRGSALQAVKDWRRRRPATPWFLFVHTQGAHAPYAPVDLPAPERLRALWPATFTDPWPPIYWEVFRGQLRLDPAEARWLRARYWATAVQADRELARLLRLIAPWRDDTIVIVTSDHGEELGEHGSWIKHGHHLHDVLLRVPLIVAGPGVVAGEWAAIVSLLDVLPTVLELAGLDVLPGADGVSLAPVLRGDAIHARPVASGAVQSSLGVQRSTLPRGGIVIGRSPCAPARVRHRGVPLRGGPGSPRVKRGLVPGRPVVASPAPTPRPGG